MKEWINPEERETQTEKRAVRNNIGDQQLRGNFFSHRKSTTSTEGAIRKNRPQIKPTPRKTKNASEQEKMQRTKRKRTHHPTTHANENGKEISHQKGLAEHIPNKTTSQKPRFFSN